MGGVFRKHTAVLCWLLLALWAALFYHGIALSDEYLYAFNAREWLNGHWPQTPSPFAHRIGFVWPLAVVMYLFGGAPRLLILPAGLAFVWLVWSVVRAGRSSGAGDLLSRSFPAAAGLLALNPALLYHAADVSHDMLMVAPATAAVMMLWKQRRGASGALFSLLLFWAFLSKESVVYLLPFLLWFFAQSLRSEAGGSSDAWRPDSALPGRFWLWAIGTGVFLGLLYLGMYAWWKGDPLYRFAGMAEHNLGPYSYHGKSLSEKLLRLSIYPFVFLLRSPGFGVLLVPVLGVLAEPGLRRQLWSKARFFVVWFFSLLAMHWFGSSSLQEWNPLTLDERMWLLLLPPLSLLAAQSEGLLRADFHTSQGRRFRLLLLWWVLFLAGLAGPAAYPEKLAGLWAVSLTALGYLLLTYGHLGFGEKLPKAGQWLWRELTRPYFVLVFPLLLAALWSLVSLKRNDTFSRERALLQQLVASEEGVGREGKILIITDSLLVDKPLAHFDFDSSRMEAVEWAYWGDFPQGYSPVMNGKLKGRKAYLLYTPRRVDLIRAFFHRSPPAWVEERLRQAAVREAVVLIAL